MQWYYAINGQRQGPVNQAEFERLVNAGTITPDTLVWRKPMLGWQTLAQVLAADPTAVVLTVSDVPPLLQASVGVGGDGGTEARTGVNIMDARPVVYGGFWRRTAAWLLDAVIVWFAAQIPIGIVGTIFFHDTMAMMEKLKGHPLTPEQAMAMMPFFGVIVLLFVLIGFVYDCFFLQKYAATPGKLAFGLAVCRTDGSRLTLGRIIGRFFAMRLNNLTLGLSYLAVAFDDEKRGVHDYVCDTRVVRTQR